MALLNTVTTGTVGTVVNYDGSGELTVQLNGATINKVTSAPAFSAYQSTAQAISAQTYTKINFQTEDFDTNSNYSTSNMRFTPTVAGYYLIIGGLNVNGGGADLQVVLYKNGAEHKFLFNTSSAGGWGQLLVNFNGSSDYVELYVWFNNAINLLAQSNLTYFQGIFIKS